MYSLKKLILNKLRIQIQQPLVYSVLKKTNFDLLTKVPDSMFSVSTYSKGGKLFNFHSLNPSKRSGL